MKKYNLNSIKLKNNKEALKGILSGVAIEFGEQPQDYRQFKFEKESFKDLSFPVGTQLRVNHGNDLHDIIGQAKLFIDDKGINFKAQLQLDHPYVVDNVLHLLDYRDEQGELMIGVSVGVNAEDLVRLNVDDEVDTLIGVTFEELSIVASPALPSSKIKEVANKQEQKEDMTQDNINIELNDKVDKLEQDFNKITNDNDKIKFLTELATEKENLSKENVELKEQLANLKKKYLKMIKK